MWIGVSSPPCLGSTKPWWSPISNSPAGIRTKPGIGPGSARWLGAGTSPGRSRIGGPGVGGAGDGTPARFSFLRLRLRLGTRARAVFLRAAGGLPVVGFVYPIRWRRHPRQLARSGGGRSTTISCPKPHS